MAGRPSKAEQWLTEDGLSLLTHWKRNDLSDIEIAKRIGISDKTLRSWKERYIPISSALKKGMSYAVADAEQALVEKFKTQTLTEKKTEIWQDADGNKKTHIVTTEKQVPPDTTAIIFFLKAKAGWRDNIDISVRSQITDERRKELDDFFSKANYEENTR